MQPTPRLRAAAAALGLAAALPAAPALALSTGELLTETFMHAQSVDALALLTVHGIGPTETLDYGYSLDVAAGAFTYEAAAGESFGGAAFTSSGAGMSSGEAGGYAWSTSTGVSGAAWSTAGAVSWTEVDATETTGDGHVVIDLPGDEDITVDFTTTLRTTAIGGQTRSVGSYTVTFLGNAETYSGFDVLQNGMWSHFLYIPELGEEPTQFLLTAAEGATLSSIGGVDFGEASLTLAPVPGPAALPLALSAVGVFGWLGRRRIGG